MFFRTFGKASEANSEHFLWGKGKSIKLFAGGISYVTFAYHHASFQLHKQILQEIKNFFKHFYLTHLRSLLKTLHDVDSALQSAF